MDIWLTIWCSKIYNKSDDVIKYLSFYFYLYLEQGPSQNLYLYVELATWSYKS